LIDGEDQVFNWGDGITTSVADGKQKRELPLPEVNPYFQSLKKASKLVVERLTSVGGSSIAQFSDKKLYGWGQNRSGLLGTRKVKGVTSDWYLENPNQIVADNYPGETVIDFSVGENTLIILTGCRLTLLFIRRQEQGVHQRYEQAL